MLRCEIVAQIRIGGHEVGLHLGDPVEDGADAVVGRAPVAGTPRARVGVELLPLLHWVHPLDDAASGFDAEFEATLGAEHRSADRGWLVDRREDRATDGLARFLLAGVREADPGAHEDAMAEILDLAPFGAEEEAYDPIDLALLRRSGCDRAEHLIARSDVPRTDVAPVTARGVYHLSVSAHSFYLSGGAL